MISVSSAEAKAGDHIDVHKDSGYNSGNGGTVSFELFRNKA